MRLGQHEVKWRIRGDKRWNWPKEAQNVHKFFKLNCSEKLDATTLQSLE